MEVPACYDYLLDVWAYHKIPRMRPSVPVSCHRQCSVLGNAEGAYSVIRQAVGCEKETSVRSQMNVSTSSGIHLVCLGPQDPPRPLEQLRRDGTLGMKDKTYLY